MKSAKSKPGATTQLTRASRPAAGRAACQWPPRDDVLRQLTAGEVRSERYRARRVGRHVAVAAVEQRSGPPECQSQTSSDRTRCQADSSPGSSRK